MSVRSIPRCWRTLIAACLPLLVTSCAAPAVLSEETISPPQANLLAPCPPPEDLPAKMLLGDLVEADAALARQYLECARRHAGLVEWARGVTRARPPGESSRN